jgi:hypothetical protein
MHDQRSSPAGGREKVADVAETAKHEMGVVADEVKHQARQVASDVRSRVSDEAGHRQQQLADRLRRSGEELREMAAGREESPARMTVERLAGRTEQVADYLSKRRPEDVLAEVQDFARRRPVAFLVSAAVAGFVVGRLTKGVVSDRLDGSGQDRSFDASTYRSASAPTGPTTTAVDQVPAVGVATAPETSYAAGVAPVPASVAATPVPPEHAPPPVTAPPVTAAPTDVAPPPPTGGETR